MQTIGQFDFFTLNFDKDGALTAPNDRTELLEKAGAATDAILISHGFRNSVDEATTLYTNFLTTLRQQLGRPEFAGIAARKFVVGGIYWPSKAFREDFGSGGSVQSADDSQEKIESLLQQLLSLKETEADPAQAEKLDEAMALLPLLEQDPDAQNRFVGLVLSLLDGVALGAEEGLDQVRAQDGSALLSKLRLPVVVPAGRTMAAGSDGGVESIGSFAAPAESDGGVQSFGSFGASILSGAGLFLNSTTWYIMKNRCGVVGATGAAKMARDLKASNPNLKIHLVGHSLGGRLMASCAKALSQDPLLRADSLTLLEAAFSHYGFSANNGAGAAGFFRDVIGKKVVRGPLVATFSALDTVVGHVYAIASRVAGDNVKAIGDASDPFGGIGRNGAQKTDESAEEPLHPAGTPYHFQTGIVTSLDGSDHLIKDHGDVTNENVVYAFASSMATT